MSMFTPFLEAVIEALNDRKFLFSLGPDGLKKFNAYVDEFKARYFEARAAEEAA